MASSSAWEKIFKTYHILQHNFDEMPFFITAQQIKDATKKLSKTTEKEVRLLCSQNSRRSRPKIFVDNGLFILSVKKTAFAIIKGEGYVDLPEITSEPELYVSKLEFELETSTKGDSEMQHLDFAYAVSLIRTFVEDSSLILTIRGRKSSKELNFYVGKHKISVSSVQTEVDAGYEGKDKVVLVEAKNTKSTDANIRQLFYPYKQWQRDTKKKVLTVFFEKRKNEYSFWLFTFEDANNYNSIKLVKSKKYIIE